MTGIIALAFSMTLLLFVLSGGKVGIVSTAVCDDTCDHPADALVEDPGSACTWCMGRSPTCRGRHGADLLEIGEGAQKRRGISDSSLKNLLAAAIVRARTSLQVGVGQSFERKAPKKVCFQSIVVVCRQAGCIYVKGHYHI
jgi:hypothetical protein